MSNKLGIIVPYRNRFEHLAEFKKSIVSYLSDKDINYEIIIVQQDDAKLFNRGMLLNIGFKYAKKYRCDYVVFHDVDMLPVTVNYAYSDIPLHMSTHFVTEPGEKEREIFDTYFGGVTMFPTNTFELINGYSNKYWGWGFEDDDLLLRCKEHFVKLNRKRLKNIGGNGKLLSLNGVDAYVKGKNIIDFNNDFTINICFQPDNLKLEHSKSSDEFTIFSIPGYDFAISYTSFGRYTFCAFDNDLTPHFVNSNIISNYKTNISIVYTAFDKIVKVYQDGRFIGETLPFKKLNTKYKKEPFFYIGVGNPNRETIPNWFRGYFEYFTYHNSALQESELLEIAKNENNLLNTNFGNYNSSESLKTYYNVNYINEYILKDLSKNKNHGEIIACEIIDSTTDEYKEIYTPVRRPSRFSSLKHEDNGFIGNMWKDQNTRWNQLRFINEVSNDKSLLYNDGLSDLEFIEHGIYKEGNITTINVGI
jgi:hypothetical protein